MNLKGKIALVTGASRGIGEAIALELARQGATVAGTATSGEGAAKITAALQEYGGAGFTLNVADTTLVEAVYQQISAQLGVPAILVNNAGITRDNLVLRMKTEEWDEVINTNLTSVYRLSKVCLKAMVKARWGRIINISSATAASGNPGQANYAAAKAGMIGFTRSLAQEIASRNITVNAVAPGLIETDMARNLSTEQRQALLAHIPMQRLGIAQDIAHAVAFLAGESANYITGQTLHVNGGLYMG